MATGRESSTREGVAISVVTDQISQAVQSTSNLLHLMQQSSPSQFALLESYRSLREEIQTYPKIPLTGLESWARLSKLPKNLLEKTDTIKNTGQVLAHLPVVISSLDAHMENGLHSVPRLRVVAQLLNNMESCQLNPLSEAQTRCSSKSAAG